MVHLKKLSCGYLKLYSSASSSGYLLQRSVKIMEVMGGSPGLEVMGGASCSKGREFES